MEALNKYAELYKRELLEQVMPFWERHSIDTECGGYFTCLDRRGEVYDTDKFMWLQGRQVWMLSMLYNQVEQRPEWLQMAEQGAQFMERYGRDSQGQWYFSLTRQGQPLVQPYNIFSDCFAAMGFGELYKATGNPRYNQIAVDTYYHIIARKDNPKRVWSKAYPGTRNLKNFALPMILCNLSLILEEAVGSQTIDSLVPPLIEDIMTNFLDKETGLILENVRVEGGLSDSFDGRVINPGHVNEAMWFLADLAVRYNDPKLVAQCEQILLRNTEYGWDNEHGGIFYFMDIQGHPVQQLEWDQKLWWVHIESMIAFAKLYKLTGNPKTKEWFLKLHEYTWPRFRDTEYGGDWFGYLNRQGEPLLTLKGGKWKGCFHVPRGLYQLWKTLEQPEQIVLTPKTTLYEHTKTVETPA